MHAKQRLVVTLGGLAASALALALPLASQASGGRPLAHATRGCEPSGQIRTFAYTPALRTYDDSIEDSGNAPDFCAEEFVTNDSQTITMGIHIHNRSDFVAGDSYAVYLDTDRNPATGAGGVGAEYEIAFTAAPVARLERWNGTDFDAASALPVPVIWVRDYGPLLVFLRSVIGDPAAFNLVLVSAHAADGDRAPDSGSWSYTRRPFALRMRSLSVGAARAGRAFTARALVLRSDFDEPLDEGEIGCAARLSRHSLAGKGRFTARRVACTWRLPKTARGKRLSGTVSVAYQGVHVTGGFSVRVR